MRLAHFIHRYPPALGGAEAYFGRLSRYCAAQGDAVTVFTSNALSLDAFWSSRGSSLLAGASQSHHALRDQAFVRSELWQRPQPGLCGCCQSPMRILPKYRPPPAVAPYAGDAAHFGAVAPAFVMAIRRKDHDTRPQNGQAPQCSSGARCWLSCKHAQRP